jgi:Terpene cyclase DEP1
MDKLTRHSGVLLALFCGCLVALNVWRLEDWGVEGFRVWFTHTIMQTTLFDFGWVLAIVLVFVHEDAKRVGIRYWWIVPTFPFMPTIGLLLYFVARQRALASRGTDGAART